MDYLNYEIKKIKWAHQAMDLTPLATSNCFGLTKTSQDKIGESFGVIILYYKKSECEVYFPQNKIDDLGQLYLDQMANIDNLYKSWLAVAKKVENESLRIKNTDLEKLPDFKLMETVNKMNDYFMAGWADSGFVESYDNTSHKIIQNYLIKYGLNKVLTDKERHDLLSPAILTIVQKERFDFITMLLYVKTKKLKLQKEVLLNDAYLLSLMRKYVDNYFFIGADYAKAPIITVSDVGQKIIKEVATTDIERELAEFRMREKECLAVLKAKKEIIKKHKISTEMENVFNFFSVITKWRDERKKMHQMGICAIEKLVSEVARRKNISSELVRYLVIQDFQYGFEYLTNITPILRKRQQESISIVDEFGNIVWLYGDQAKKFKNEIDQTLQVPAEKIIKGSIASKGKVQGIAKIIKSVEFFDKFHEGEILVTSMTRVEFMPVVRIAKAIVTDEGGITCHAAIVSRELGIPCVIGTKNATKNIKDGDLIEVDADNGVIKLLDNLK